MAQIQPVSTASPPKPVIGVGIVIIRPGPQGPEVLLIQRGQPPGVGYWSIPGGRQEFGETVRETAIREALEETGLHVSNPRLIDVVDAATSRPDENGALHHWTLIEFRVDYLGGEAVAGDDAAAVKWVPLSDLPDLGLWDETVRIIMAGAAMP
jgi:ADP-ribose pyrophosphatase YjhB (NUDIX family)